MNVQGGEEERLSMARRYLAEAEELAEAEIASANENRPSESNLVRWHRDGRVFLAQLRFFQTWYERRRGVRGFTLAAGLGAYTCQLRKECETSPSLGDIGVYTSSSCQFTLPWEGRTR